MTISRREFLIGAGAAAGASVVGVAGPAFGAAPVDPASAERNRLVVIFLEGGNDGLNYVVPRGDVPGAPRYSVYRKVRPTIAYQPGAVLPLDRGADADQLLGFNPKLTHLHALYRAGRVAVVQGVDYPNHNYSHFTSQDIWHSGNPTNMSTGWIGRHLDRAGVGDGELRAVAVGTKLPLMLQGRGVSGASIASIGAMRFGDGTGAVAEGRHRALADLGGARRGDPVRQRVGVSLRQAVDVVTDLAKTRPPAAGASSFGEALRTARTLLAQNLGVETVYLSVGGFDTHTTEVSAQEQLLGDLDNALDAFWAGLSPALADRTLVMLASEFGRRIGEANGGVGVAGTDHGAAAPVVLVGPPSSSFNGGLHGDHPNMGTTSAPADNLALTTDVRHVYQAVLQSWLGDPDPLYDDAESGPLRGLFNESRAGGAGGRTRIGTATRIDAPDGATAATAAVLDRAESRGRQALRVGGGATKSTGRSVPLSSATAALAFNAFVAAIVVRSGRFRAALAARHDTTDAS